MNTGGKVIIYSFLFLFLTTILLSRNYVQPEFYKLLQQISDDLDDNKVKILLSVFHL